MWLDRPIARVENGKKGAGVIAGLARTYGFDLTLGRWMVVVATIVLPIIAGIGPSEGPAAAGRRGHVGVAVVALGLALAGDLIGLFDVGFVTGLAVIVGVVGLGLITGAFIGGGRWLVLAALVGGWQDTRTGAQSWIMPMALVVVGSVIATFALAGRFRARRADTAESSDEASV